MVLETVLRVYQSLNITGIMVHGFGNCAARFTDVEILHGLWKVDI